MAAADARPMMEKLCSALRHPEPETAVRAAWFLGKRREVQAIPELIRTVESAKDGFLVEAAAEALGQMGDERALCCLKRAATNGAVRVRIAANEATRKISERLRNREINRTQS